MTWLEAFATAALISAGIIGVFFAVTYILGG